MVSMANLKRCFEQLGFSDVKTYINSGNVVFNTEQGDAEVLATRIQTALDQVFEPGIRVLVKSYEALQRLASAIPADWANDSTAKCDVLFLWPEIDTPDLLSTLPIDPDLEDVRHIPGAVLWHIDRSQVATSRMARLTGSKIYRQMTVRNVNTVRRLLELADAID